MMGLATKPPRGEEMLRQLMVVGGIRNNKGKSVHVYDYIKLKLAKEEDL